MLCRLSAVPSSFCSHNHGSGDTFWILVVVRHLSSVRLDLCNHTECLEVFSIAWCILGLASPTRFTLHRILLPQGRLSCYLIYVLSLLAVRPVRICIAPYTLPPHSFLQYIALPHPHIPDSIILRLRMPVCVPCNLGRCARRRGTTCIALRSESAWTSLYLCAQACERNKTRRGQVWRQYARVLYMGLDPGNNCWIDSRGVDAGARKARTLPEHAGAWRLGGDGNENVGHAVHGTQICVSAFSRRRGPRSSYEFPRSRLTHLGKTLHHLLLSPARLGRRTFPSSASLRSH